MKANTIRRPCEASGRHSDKFGGGIDQCPVCGRLVYIAVRDGRVAKHLITVPADEDEERRRWRKAFADARLG